MLVLVTGAEAIRRLRAAGWIVVRVRGSHRLLEKGGRVVPIPVHGKKDLGLGLLAAIERQTGVKLR